MFFTQLLPKKIREFLRGNLYVFSLYLAMENLLVNWRTKHHTGRTFNALSVEEGVEYVDEVFREYLEVGQFSTADILGKKILEVGPGDNFGVALKFIAAGAEQVVALDRFSQIRDSNKEANVYRCLEQDLSQSEALKMKSAYGMVNGKIQVDPQMIDYWENCPVESYKSSDGFDLIVSRSVLEHVADLKVVFEAFARLLKPGGTMIHRVDLRAHGMFTDRSDMFFLTLPSWWWSAIGSRTGNINRTRCESYTQLIRQTGFEVTNWIINHHYSDFSVKSVRPNLAREFSPLSDEELSVAGFSFSARRRV